MTLHLQVLYKGVNRFAEVQFYFRGKIQQEHVTLALISLYSLPDAKLLSLSCNALVVCAYQGLRDLRVVEIESILSVVAMVPFGQGGIEENAHFLVEKPGLEVAVLGDVREDIEEE